MYVKITRLYTIWVSYRAVSNPPRDEPDFAKQQQNQKQFLGDLNVGVPAGPISAEDIPDLAVLQIKNQVPCPGVPVVVGVARLILFSRSTRKIGGPTVCIACLGRRLVLNIYNLWQKGLAMDDDVMLCRSVSVYRKFVPWVFLVMIFSKPTTTGKGVGKQLVFERVHCESEQNPQPSAGNGETIFFQL